MLINAWAAIIIVWTLNHSTRDVCFMAFVYAHRIGAQKSMRRLTARLMKGEKMIIRLPHIEPFDTLRPPENLEELVRKSFASYSHIVKDEFKYELKLAYIDDITRRFMNPATNCPKDAIWEMIKDDVYKSLTEHDELPDKDYFKTFEFMQRCYNKALNATRLYSIVFEPNVPENTKTLETLVRIIKIVMNWEPKNE